MELLYSLFDFEGTGNIPGSQIALLCSCLFRTACATLYGGDIINEPAENSIQCGLERLGIYSNTSVDIGLFRQITKPLMKWTNNENSNLSILTNVFSLFGCALELPLPENDPEDQEDDDEAHQKDRNGQTDANAQQAQQEKHSRQEKEDQKKSDEENAGENSDLYPNSNTANEEKKTQEEEEKNKQQQLKNQIKKEKKQYMMLVDKIRAENPGNLVAKFMTHDVIELYGNVNELKKLTSTAMKESNLKCCLAAPSSAAYDNFSMLYDPLIREVHHGSPEDTHLIDINCWDNNHLQKIEEQLVQQNQKMEEESKHNHKEQSEQDLDNEWRGGFMHNSVILAIQLQVDLQRNVTQLPLAPALNTRERKELETSLLSCLSSISLVSEASDSIGTDFQFFTMETAADVIEEDQETPTSRPSSKNTMSKTFDFGTVDFASKNYATCLACGVFDDYPVGRGGCIHQDKETNATTMIKYGGENHISIGINSALNKNDLLSNELTTKLIKPFQLLRKTHDQLEQQLFKQMNSTTFARTNNYGYTTCLTEDLGTAMRASAVIRYQQKELDVEQENGVENVAENETTTVTQEKENSNEAKELEPKPEPEPELVTIQFLTKHPFGMEFENVTTTNSIPNNEDDEDNDEDDDSKDANATTTTVVVTSVEPNSQADKQGIQVGWTITCIKTKNTNTNITDVDMVSSAINELKNKTNLIFEMSEEVPSAEDAHIDAGDDDIEDHVFDIDVSVPLGMSIDHPEEDCSHYPAVVSWWNLVVLFNCVSSFSLVSLSQSLNLTLCFSFSVSFVVCVLGIYRLQKLNRGVKQIQKVYK